jgi:hypothetical protein
VEFVSYFGTKLALLLFARAVLLFVSRNKVCKTARQNDTAVKTMVGND